MNRALSLLETLNEMDSINELTDKTKKRLKQAGLAAGVVAGSVMVGRGITTLDRGLNQRFVANTIRKSVPPNSPAGIIGQLAHTTSKSTIRKGAATAVAGYGTILGSAMAYNNSTMKKKTKTVNGKRYILKNGRWHLA